MTTRERSLACEKEDEDMAEAQEGKQVQAIVPKIIPPTLRNAHAQIFTMKVGNGDEKTTFVIHAEFLKFWSPYFKKAIEKTLQMGSDTMEVDDTTPAAFGLLSYWIYYQNLKDPLQDEPTINDLIHLWLLASKAQIPRLQNEAIQAINLHPEKQHMIATQDYREIYTEKTRETLLGRFLAATVARCLDTIKHPDNFPRDMLIDIIASARRQLLKRLKGGRPSSVIIDQLMAEYLITGGDGKPVLSEKKEQEAGIGI